MENPENTEKKEIKEVEQEEAKHPNSPVEEKKEIFNKKNEKLETDDIDISTEKIKKALERDRLLLLQKRRENVKKAREKLEQKKALEKEQINKIKEENELLKNNKKKVSYNIMPKISNFVLSIASITGIIILYKLYNQEYDEEEYEEGGEEYGENGKKSYYINELNDGLPNLNFL